MNRITLIFGSLLFLLCSSKTFAQENPGPDIDSFQHEIDSANAWYDGSGTAYTFSMLDIHRSFGDPIQGPGEFGAIPGEDLLDNDMLGTVLAQAGLHFDGDSATVYDTTYFAYYGYVFERQARYECWRKDCDSITLDSDVFRNTPLYRVRETSIIWKRGDPLVDSPWHIRNFYYSVPDSGTHLTSTLCYWSEVMAGWGHAKFLQNARSVNTYKASTQKNALTLLASPIPAHDQLRISISGIKNLQERASLEILNLNGNLVQQWTNVPVSGVSIDVSVIPPGLYILRAISPSGKAVKRFSIMR